MPDPLACTRCGADAIIPRVRVLDRDEGGAHRDLQAEVQRRPNAMLFKRPERSTISAQVCGACGHAELYVEAPRALYAAYIQADASPTVSALEELDRTREALADSTSMAAALRTPAGPSRTSVNWLIGVARL